MTQKKRAVIINQSVLKKGVLASHSRIRDPQRPEQKYSEVWTDICRGAQWRAKERSVVLDILSPLSYHEHDEFLKLVGIAVERKPDFLILPFTLLPSSGEEKLLDILDDFPGRIVAVNVPPSDLARARLGKRLAGYVGMNEYGAGQRAALELIQTLSDGFRYNPEMKAIVVPKHEEGHYGHWLRIEGIKEVARIHGIPVREEFVGAEKQKRLKLGEGKYGVITLGNRGTEAALADSVDQKQILGLVGMDLNPTIANAILDTRVKATLIQHPYQQGALAIDMALGPGGTYYCGPTLINMDNVRVFNL